MPEHMDKPALPELTLNEYQKRARVFASYSGNAAGMVPEDVLKALNMREVPQELMEFIRDIATFLYPSSKLAGEAGEIAEKLAKQVRDKKVFRFQDVSEEDRESLKYELGDVLWYVGEIAYKLGYTLQKIGEANIEKLEGRVERGTIHGDGDNR